MPRPKMIISSKEDVFTAINAGRVVSSRSFLIGLIALGGTFVDAYDFTSLGVGTVQLKTQFHLTSTALGSLAGVTADLWRYAVGIGALPAAVVLLLRYRYMDESPMWAAR